MPSSFNYFLITAFFIVLSCASTISAYTDNSFFDGKLFSQRSIFSENTVADFIISFGKQ